MGSPRHRGATRTLAVAATLLAGVGAGCDAVPDLRFVLDAGAADAPEDGGGAGDIPEGGGLDGATGSSCSGPSPEPGATCCGTAWCIGECDAKNCEECAQAACSTSELCCGKKGTVLCKPQCP